MTDMEIMIADLILACQQRNVYWYKKYQMLHGLKYQKNMAEETQEKIRRHCPANCYRAAFELKTYYMENGFLSNTIVLKMRPGSSEDKVILPIAIHSELDGTDHIYSHHAIEVFQEHGRYKVLDVLHNNKMVWLETYLDEVCRTNGCQRKQLRYDKGYLVSANTCAENMQGLMDLMTYLDKEYKLGLPRMNFINTGNSEEEIWLSDDIAMDFKGLGKEFGADAQTVINTYHRIYDMIGSTQMELLKMMCYVRIIGDRILCRRLEEKMFDMSAMCQMINDYFQEMKREGHDPFFNRWKM